MSLYPQMVAMGQHIPSVKRGAKGPTPARGMKLFDASKVNKTTGLVVRLAVTGEVLCASKPELSLAGGELPAPEAHALYDRLREDRFMRWAQDEEIPRLEKLGFSAKRIAREIGRTFRMRYLEGRHEKEVQQLFAA